MTTKNQVKHPNLAKLVCIGQIGKPFGLAGHFYLSGRDSDEPFRYAKVKAGNDPESLIDFQIDECRLSNARTILKFKGVLDRTAIERFKNQKIWVFEAQISSCREDEYLWNNLIGLKVLSSDSVETIGWIDAVHNFGAGDILQIRSESRTQQLLLPFIAAYFDTDFRVEDQCVRAKFNLEFCDDYWEGEKK